MDAIGTLRNKSAPLSWLLPAMIILLLVYLLPLVQVIAISVLEPSIGFGNYKNLLLDEELRRIFWTTFRISGLTTVISVALGYVVAFAMVNSTPRMFRLMLICVLIPFWISVLVRAFAWMTLLRSGGLVNQTLIGVGLIDEPLDLIYNEFGVVLGMVHYMVPLAVLTLYGQMSGIDPRLAIAARGLGAGPWYAFRRIFLPLSLPGIAAACILIFISGLGFYIVPALLGGGRTLMLAEYVSLMISTTVNWGQGTAMASTLAILVLLLMFLLSRIVDLRRVFGGA